MLVIKSPIPWDVSLSDSSHLADEAGGNEQVYLVSKAANQLKLDYHETYARFRGNFQQTIASESIVDAWEAYGPRPHILG